MYMIAIPRLDVFFFMYAGGKEEVSDGEGEGEEEEEEEGLVTEVT